MQGGNLNVTYFLESTTALTLKGSYTMEDLDRLYPKLRIGHKCINPNCNNDSCHIHHVVGRSNMLLRYDVQNLIPLCAKCHSEIHDKGMYNRGADFLTTERKNYLLSMKNVSFKDYLLQHGLTQDEFFEIKKRELLESIGKTDLKQNTPEWLSRKQLGIGASEIAAVVKSFVSEEDLIKILGEKTAHSFIDEPLFITGYVVYHKIAKGYRIPPLDDELNLYGHAMEGYFNWLMQDDEDFEFKGSEDFVERPDISKWAVCSPDGYAYAKRPIVDINGRPIEGTDFVWEKKTVSTYKAKKEEMVLRGLPWQYIFQNQYQMMMCNREGGVISSLVLQEDTPFIRGRLTAYCELGLFDKIHDLYQPRVDHFVYKRLPEIQEAILLGLHNFEVAIEKGLPPAINLSTGRLAENDFRIYQAVYKSNPEARKMATSQDDYTLDGQTYKLDDYLDEFLDLNNIIKDNAEKDKLSKIAMKKYLYDNKLVELYSGRGGSVKLSKSGALIIRSNNE